MLLLSQPHFKQTNRAGAPLSEMQVRKLVRESFIEKFSKDTEIYKQGEEDDFLSLVLDGQLDVEVDGDQNMANKFQVLAL